MKCIAMASGKGGVGKTLLTAAFGFALAEEGRRVLLIDGDMGLRNLDIPLGLSDRLKRNAWDLARGRCLEKEAILSAGRGLDFLPASEEEGWKEISRPALHTVLEDVAERYDVVLLDCPAGLGKGIRFAEEAADAWILVVGPSRASLRDAARMADRLRGTHPFHVIFNNFQCGSEAAVSLASVMKEAEVLPVLGAVPHSAEADRLAQEGRLAALPGESAFREAVSLVLHALRTGAAYPLSRWEALLGRAAAESKSGDGGASPLAVWRRRQSGARWRRRP